MRKMLVLAVALAVIWAAGAMAFTPKHPVVARDDNTMLKKSQGPLPTPLLVSPGYGVGVTDLDWPRNGSMIKTVALDGQHGVHFYWTFRTGGDPATRRGYYNFKDETGGWLGGLAHDGRVSRMGSLGVLSDGRACPTSHVTLGSGPNASSVAVDAVRGGGAFNITDIDTTIAATWPSIAVGGSDVIHVISVVGPPIYYSRSTNQGATFSPYTTLATDVNGAEYLGIAARGLKVAFAYTDSTDPSGGNIWLRESNDAGATWGARSPIFTNGSRYVGWIMLDALYSPTDLVHVVYTVNDTTTPSQGQIRHWSQATGETVVRDGNWNTHPGANHLTVSSPSLGYQASASRWWCTWVEFTAADTSTNGYANGEVYAAYSSDGGATWRGARNLTNSPTPGAPPGMCADDRYQSLAAVVDDTLRVFYMSSFTAGSSMQDVGSTISTDTMRYYQTPATVGVEEFTGSEKAPASFELGASRPNPTGAKTAIQYSLPAAAEVNLSVYNAAGQLVETLASGHRAAGVHTANWEARSVPAGVYFYRLTAGTFTQTRSMVVVR
jgi:hypothetical protein